MLLQSILVHQILFHHIAGQQIIQEIMKTLFTRQLLRVAMIKMMRPTDTAAILNLLQSGERPVQVSQ